jgi:hypothetical protein
MSWPAMLSPDVAVVVAADAFAVAAEVSAVLSLFAHAAALASTRVASTTWLSRSLRVVKQDMTISWTERWPTPGSRAKALDGA